MPQIASHIWAFVFHVYIHLTNFECQGYAHFYRKYLGNGDRLETIAVAIKWKATYWLSLCIFIIFEYKGQGQYPAHFDCKSLENGVVCGNQLLRSNTKTRVRALDWYINIWPWLTHNGQRQSHAYFHSKYLGNGERYDKYYYCHKLGSHDWLSFLVYLRLF